MNLTARFAMPNCRRTVLLWIVLLSLATPAQAEIAISPLRHVITPADPVAVFEVSNPSKRIIDVRADWIDLTTTPTGYVDAPAENRVRYGAAPFLSLSPAQFRLQPGARRRVAIRLRDGARLDQKERRSHLLLKADAQRSPITRTGGLQADIGLAVSVPVILRDRPGPAKAKFADTSLGRDKDGYLQLETSIVRGGPYSPYGRLEAKFVAENAPDQANLRTHLDNVAVNMDIPAQSFAVPLGIEELPAGVLTLRYLGNAEYEGEIFAQKTFEILGAE